MDRQENQCPYVVGNTIKLHLEMKDNAVSTDARIIKLFEPFTLSSVMVVRVTCSDLALEGNMVLKLLIDALRDSSGKMKNFVPGLQTLRGIIISSSLMVASQFITELNNNGDIAQQGETWNSSQDEAYLHNHLFDLYETEVRVYDTVRDMQGNGIPQLLACVTIPGCSLAEMQPARQYVDVAGILLEYIEGFPLTDTADHTPKECWQSICEEAIQILHRMGDHGILNEDVKTRSFIVKKDTRAESGCKVVMIDFALCNFRKDYADDVDWSEAKAIQDEEGAVGLIMQDRLEGGFAYRRSNRYQKPAHHYE